LYICAAFSKSYTCQFITKDLLWTDGISCQKVRLHSAELIAMSSPCVIRPGLLNKVKEYCNGNLAMDKEQLLGLLDQRTMFKIRTRRNHQKPAELKHVLKQYGFDIVLNKLEGMNLPVTKFGRSRNDHLLSIKTITWHKEWSLGILLEPVTLK